MKPRSPHDVRRLLPLLLLGCALGVACRAGDYTNASAIFALGPNETQFAFPVPAFDPAGHPEAPRLTGVDLYLQAVRTVDVALVPPPGAAESGPWNAGTASLTATPAGANLPALGPLNLGIVGTNDALGADLTLLAPSPSVAGLVSTEVPSGDVSAWTAPSAVAYDLDFAAPYTEVMGADGISAGASANDRITGQLIVVFHAEPASQLSLGIAPLPAGFQLEISGPAGAGVQILQTADLAQATWAPAGQVTLGPGGAASLIVAPSPGASFFRAVIP